MSRMKSEDAIGAKARPFTGAEYLESLRDGREVYIYGERVEGRHHASGVPQRRALDRAALRRAARSASSKDVLTAPTDTGSGGYHPQVLPRRALARGRDRPARRHRGLGAHVLRLDGPLARTTRPR